MPQARTTESGNSACYCGNSLALNGVTVARKSGCSGAGAASAIDVCVAGAFSRAVPERVMQDPAH